MRRTRCARILRIMAIARRSGRLVLACAWLACARRRAERGVRTVLNLSQRSARALHGGKSEGRCERSKNAGEWHACMCGGGRTLGITSSTSSFCSIVSFSTALTSRLARPELGCSATSVAYEPGCEARFGIRLRRCVAARRISARAGGTPCWSFAPRADALDGRAPK
jgi:hypothetical protein